MFIHMKINDVILNEGRKYVRYLLVGFEYFQSGLAQEVNQDRTRRALSNGLFTFLSTPFQHKVNILPIIKGEFQKQRGRYTSLALPPSTPPPRPGRYVPAKNPCAKLKPNYIIDFTGFSKGEETLTISEPRSNKHGRKRSYTEEYGPCTVVYERIRIP
jgi:hypothetical protein